MGTGDLCRVPPAAEHPGRARHCSGTGLCGYCRRVLWVTGPRDQYLGKIRFIEKPEVQDEGVLILCFIRLLILNFMRQNVIDFDRLQSDCMHTRTVERTYDRTSQKQYTRSLVLPSWRHET